MSLWNGTQEDLALIGNAVQRMFDLGADPAVLRSTMRADSTLGKLWEQNPGLRVARAFSGYESMIGTILGQLVSVKFGAY